MSYLDIIIIIPLLWGAFKGFKKGLIIELTSLIALIAGIWLAVNFSTFVSDVLSSKIFVNSTVMSIISFAIVFIGVVILVYFVGKSIEKFIKLIALGLINRVLGSIFGVLKFAFLLSVVLFFAETVDNKINILDEDAKNKSILYNPVKSSAPIIISLFKKESFNEWFSDVEEKINDSKETIKDNLIETQIN